ncbi:hypothetical protein LTV02_08895 [Nocardia yamanashiensis]|uniref:hypothetical protein n=1 Tax=Nocardia yamanashiensis TaxID=209247 RepID=UPI001E33D207|nr:hypothetical protein [Nocardia yamanashiensis]UGT43481.1 hypothetical protein LTV02_08895 [Nocardia yamanashiensis]
MSTQGRTTTARRSQTGRAGQGGGAASKKRALGAPDVFVWLPVMGLFMAAGICATIGQSILLAAGLVAAAVVLVVADMWINR